MTATRALRAAAVLGLVAVFAVGILRSVGSSSPTLEASFSPSQLPMTAAASGGDTGGQQFVVASANGASLDVYARPGAPTPSIQLPNPSPVGAPAVVLVLDQQAGQWLHVLVPVRPNDSTGWVRVPDVTLRTDPYGVRVDLGQHRLTVWRGDSVVMNVPAGVGQAVTNTPQGVYFLTELLRAPDPGGLYGPYAFGTSAFSDVLTEFAGGNGTIGIHGTNDPAGIGKDVSHGCIRVRNEVITQLAGMLPLGTPVFVVP